jgi:hypothetical protein
MLPMSTLAPILGVVALTLLVGAAAVVNLHHSESSAEATTAKPAHHMASLGEIKALLQKAQADENR